MEAVEQAPLLGCQAEFLTARMQRVGWWSARMLQLDPLLGPLAPLVGSWEGGAGLDLAPDEDDRRSTATSKFREVMTFEPLGLVDNHQQSLYGLRYTTFAWRIDEPEPFHQELGYWLWDADAKLIMRCFTIPRGVALLAGGHAEPDARRFELAAALGSTTFGIIPCMSTISTGLSGVPCIVRVKVAPSKSDVR